VNLTVVAFTTLQSQYQWISPYYAQGQIW